MAGVVAATQRVMRTEAGLASQAAFGGGAEPDRGTEPLFSCCRSASVHAPGQAHVGSQHAGRSAFMCQRRSQSINTRCREKLLSPSASSRAACPYLAPPFSSARIPQKKRRTLVRASASSSDQLVPSSQVINSADYEVQQQRIDSIMKQLHELDPGIAPAEEAAIISDLNNLSAEHLSLIENSTGKNRNISSWASLLKRLIALKERGDPQRWGQHEHRKVWLAEQKLLKTLGWVARLREALSRLLSWQGLIFVGAFLLSILSVNLVWRPRAKIVTRPVQYSQFLKEVRHGTPRSNVMFASQSLLCRLLTSPNHLFDQLLIKPD